jgi:Zinc-finger double-stranded RNA-binding
MPETAVSSSTSNRPRKQYRCSLCDKPFDSAETLDSHQNFEHSNPGHCKPVAGAADIGRKSI